MRKLTLIFMTLILFNLSFAKEKIDTTFTFQGFSPTSPSVVKTTKKIKVIGKSRISYPSFLGRNSDVIKNMNAIMHKFISAYKSTKHISYNTTYEITADNSSYLSVLFTINITDTDTGQKTKVYNAIAYNLKNGRSLQLKDLFTTGFNEELKGVINTRFKQFGLPQIDSFDAIAKNQNFYLQNDSLVIFYNKGEATNFADGEVFIPFLLTDLIGILK